MRQFFVHNKDEGVETQKKSEQNIFLSVFIEMQT